MKKYRSNIRRYSPRAALAAVGLKINSLRLLAGQEESRDSTEEHPAYALQCPYLPEAKALSRIKPDKIERDITDLIKSLRSV